MDVAIGTYSDGRVVAWRVGTSPPVVVYEGNGSLTSVWAHVEHQGYRVVLTLDELQGSRGVCLLLLGETKDVDVGSVGVAGGDRRSDAGQ